MSKNKGLDFSVLQNIDSDINRPLDYSSLDNLSQSPYAGNVVTGQQYDQYSRVLDGQVYPEFGLDYLQSRAAGEQGFLGETGNMLVQFGGEVAGGTMEGIGYLFELDDAAKMVRGAEVELGNALTNLGQSIREGSKEIAPIYRSPEDEGKFQPWSYEWWMANGSTIGSSLSLMLPATGVTKGLSYLGKGTKLAAELSKTSKLIGKGVTSAIISRHMENMMEASGSYDQTLNALISQGVDIETAQKEAAKAASDTYKADWAMLAQDIFQYTTLTKPFGKATEDLTIKMAKKLGVDVAPVIANKFKEIGLDMVGEAGEEAYQYIASARAQELAEYRAGLRDKGSLSETLKEALKDGEFSTSMWMGAMGAGFMQTAGKSLSLAKNRIRGIESEDERRLGDIASWGESISGLASIQQAGEAIGSDKLSTKDQQFANFGAKLASNGNLDWFLQVSDNFTNLNEEEQQNLGINADDIQQFKDNFPTYKQDLQKIGETYEGFVNNSGIHPRAAVIAATADYVLNKQEDDIKKLDAEYQGISNDITGLSRTFSPTITNAYKLENIEIPGIKATIASLEKTDADKSIIDVHRDRLKIFESALASNKETFSEKDNAIYNSINKEDAIRNNPSFTKAYDKFIERESKIASISKVRNDLFKYTDPNNIENINKEAAKVDEEAIKSTVEQVSTPEEAEVVSRLFEEPIQEDIDVIESVFGNEPMQVPDDEAGASKSTSKLANIAMGKKALSDKRQEELVKTSDVEEASDITSATQKYQESPNLYNQDVKEFRNNLETVAQEDPSVAQIALTFDDRASLNPRQFDKWFNQIGSANPVVVDLYNNMLRGNVEKVLDVKDIQTTQQESNTEEVIESVFPEEPKEVVEEKPTEEKITSKYDIYANVSVDQPVIKEYVPKTKEGNKGEKIYYLKTTGIDTEFTLAHLTAESKPIDVVDAEGLNSGKYKVGETVLFRLSGDNIEVVSKSTGKVIGRAISNLRNTPYERLTKDLKAGKSIESKIVGFRYNHTKNTSGDKVVYSTPLQALKESDKSDKNTGSYVMGYTENTGNDTRLIIPQTAITGDKFDNTPEGSIIILTEHPLIKEQYLYIRSFTVSLGQYRERNQGEYDKMLSWIIGQLQTGENAAIRNIRKLLVTTRRIKGSDGKPVRFNRMKFVKGNLQLFSRGDLQNPRHIISVDQININNMDLLEWINDQPLGISKKFINKNITELDLGYETKTFDVLVGQSYNDFISDFLSVTVKPQDYIEGVQPNISIDLTVNNSEKVEAKETNEAVSNEPTESVKPIDTPKQVIETSSEPKEGEPTKSTEKQFNPEFAPKKHLNIDFTDKLRKRRDDLKDKTYKPKVGDTNSYKKWNKAKELAWLKKNFPQIPVNVYEDLKEVFASGPELWGAFHNASIYIAENAGSGTAYHEAFHVVFNLFLNEKQRNQLLVNNTEEELADMFSDYVLGEQLNKSWSTKIKNFFKRLWQSIKSLYTNDFAGIEELFFRANNGFYNNYKVDPKEFKSGVLRRKIADYTAQRQKEAVDSIISSIFIDVLPAIREVNPELTNYTDVELISVIPEGIEAIYNTVVNNYIDYYNSLDKSSPYLENLSNLLYNLTQGDNGNTLLPDVIRMLDIQHGIKISKVSGKVEYSKSYNEDIDTEEYLDSVEDRAEDIKEGWQTKSRSAKENVAAEVKREIRYTVSGDVNFIGQPKFVNYDDLYNNLLSDLSGVTDSRDILNILDSLQDIHPEYSILLEKLSTNTSLLTKFFVAFNKHHGEFNIQIPIDKYDKSGNKSGTQYITMEANRANVSDIIINDWHEGLLGSKYATIDKNGTITISSDIKPVIEAINGLITKSLNTFKVGRDISEYSELISKLSDIGIDINLEVFTWIHGQKEPKFILQKFLSGTQGLQRVLNAISEGRDPFDVAESDNERTAVKNTANIVKKATPSLMEPSFMNLDNEKQFAYQERNYINKLVDSLTNPSKAQSRIDFLTKDVLNFAFERDKPEIRNRILQRLQKGIASEADLKSIFSVQTSIGADKTSFRKMSKADLESYTLNSYYNNGNSEMSLFRGPVLSDAPTTYMIKFGRSSYKEAIGRLVETAISENIRIKNIATDLETLPEDQWINNYHYSIVEGEYIHPNASTKTGYHLIPILNGSKLDPITSENYRSEVANKIDKWLRKEAKQYYKSLVDNKVIVFKNGKIDPIESKLDSRLIEKYPDKKSFEEWLLEFYANDYLTRVEFSLITTGDPAYYKANNPKEGDFSRAIDYYKRAKEIHSPKSLLDTRATFIDEETGEVYKAGTSYNTIYLSDAEIQAPSYDNTLEVLDKQLASGLITEETYNNIKNSYKKVNQTDAQAYITLPFLRKTMIGAGRWTQTHQIAYKRLEKGQGTNNDVKLIMQPLKPFMYDLTWNSKLNRLVPVQNKNSEYLLLPQLVKGNTKLENLYNFMTENGIDSANFESAVKAGLSKVISQDTFEDLEAYNTLVKDFKSDNSLYTHTLDMEARGIQQEVPEHYLDSQNLFGTQIRKLILSELPEELKDLMLEYENLLETDLLYSYSEVENEIVGENGDIDYKKLYDVILDAARTQGKGEEFEKAVEWDEARNRFRIPLYSPQANRTSQNLITALFKNGVTKQKIAGGAFVQLSSWGLSEDLKLVYTSEKQVLESLINRGLLEVVDEVTNKPCVKIGDIWKIV